MAKSFGRTQDLKIEKYLLSLSISFPRSSQYCKVFVEGGFMVIPAMNSIGTALKTFQFQNHMQNIRCKNMFELEKTSFLCRSQVISYQQVLSIKMHSQKLGIVFYILYNITQPCLDKVNKSHVTVEMNGVRGVVKTFLEMTNYFKASATIKVTLHFFFEQVNFPF